MNTYGVFEGCVVGTKRLQKISNLRTTRASCSVYRFEQVDRRFDKVDAELQRVNDRLDGVHRVLLQLGGGMIVALIGLIATQL